MILAVYAAFRRSTVPTPTLSSRAILRTPFPAAVLALFHPVWSLLNFGVIPFPAKVGR